MTKEEKQIELLNRMYVNIEGYKSLRFRIPIVICTLILAIAGFVLESDKIPKNQIQEISIIIILGLLIVIGVIILSTVKRQYNDLADNIYYLYDQLEMNGTDFYEANKDYKNHPRQRAPKVFLLGYVGMIIIGLICIVSIVLK